MIRLDKNESISIDTKAQQGVFHLMRLRAFKLTRAVHLYQAERENVTNTKKISNPVDIESPLKEALKCIRTYSK